VTLPQPSLLRLFTARLKPCPSFSDFPQPPFAAFFYGTAEAVPFVQ
jgi:hypothetical protein